MKLEILELLSERETTRDWADKLLEVPRCRSLESGGDRHPMLPRRGGWSAGGTVRMAGVRGCRGPGSTFQAYSNRATNSSPRNSEISRLGHAEGEADLTVKSIEQRRATPLFGDHLLAQGSLPHVLDQPHRELPMKHLLN